MKKIAVLLLFGLLLLPSALAACGTPGDDSQLIFRIHQQTNAHAELYNGTGNYPEEICYDAIFGSAYAGATPHKCTASNTVLWAYAATNAHVAQVTSPSYLTQICFGNLRCLYKAVCDLAGEQCIATISDTTNAHVSSLCSGVESYSIKVCCSVAVIPPDCGDGDIDAGEVCGEPSLPACSADFHCVNCQCIPTTDKFVITSFKLDQDFVRLQPAVNPVKAIVVVRNDGAGGTADVKISVLGKGEQGVNSASIAAGGISDPPIEISFDVTGWDSGNYCVTAEVQRDGVTEDSTTCRTLTVFAQRPVPTPELNELLLPLIALSVLALLFFSGRKE